MVNISGMDPRRAEVEREGWFDVPDRRHMALTQNQFKLREIIATATMLMAFASVSE